MSMHCKCGVKAKIVDSRCNAELRVTRRRYDCPACEARWTTVEIEISKDRIHLTERRAAQLRAIMEAIN